MIGRVHKASRQQGVTLFGLLFWAVIVGFLALIGMRVLPTLNEDGTRLLRAFRTPASDDATQELSVQPKPGTES